jgi:Fe-S cluster assembly protein SufD
MSFDVDANASLPGPNWLKSAREQAASAVRGRSLPKAEEELWRYSRIDDLDLDRYSLQSSNPATGLPSHLADTLPTHAVRVITVNGRLGSVDGSVAGVTIRSSSTDDTPQSLDGDEGAADYFERLNAAMVPDLLTIDISAGKYVEEPIVLVHVVDDGVVAFPRTIINAAEQSQASVVEYLVNTADAESLIIPFTKLSVNAAANVNYAAVQLLNLQSHAIAYQVSAIDRDATFRSSAIALGGSYARVRTDSRLIGKGADSRLDAVYFGMGKQMHDFRTVQDHRAPKTTSDLLFKGVVAGHSHSVYSGLIRVEKGAAGTNAFQTNRNLVLDAGARADSVPNLEIEENDVRCSHASAVGPVDEEQRYYLESRGVPSDIAERLIVTGFLNEMLDRIPVASLRPLLKAEVSKRLTTVLKVR